MAATKRAWKLQEFVAHAPSVNCVALGHKSGRVMATGGEDKKVNMWAVGKPNCIMSLSGHTSPVEAVRFGNAEEIVAAGSLSGAIKIWDLEQAKILRTLTGHKSNVKCLDFHPYGEFVASGATDSNVKLWDIRRKGCIFTYKGHSNCVNALRFSPDGRWIASASDDSLVKIWDITAGRLLADLKQHTGSVTCVEFHPNEFLLASGSSDRTVKFWDLEKLACVDSTDGDCAPIRCISFHPDGGCVFAASQDVLKVYGWEPTRCHDSVVPGWGKLSDMTVAQAQLIGVSFNQSNTATYVVDLTKVAPIGSAPGPPAPPMTGSGRRNFLTERPPTQSTKQQPPSSKPAEEPDDAQPIPNAGNQEDAGDDLSSVADVKDPQEYREIFQPRSRLAASPAVPGPTKKAEPFPAPADDGYGASPGSAAGPASSAAAGDYLAKVAPPAGPMPPQGRAAQQTAAAPDEEETLAGMNRGHDAMISALAKRNKHLQIVRAMWSSGNIKSAIDSAIHMKDDSVIVDLLNVLNLKPTSWDLDVCAILLPRLSDLLATKYESYIQVACAALRLILKNFAPIIKQNMNSPPSIGIDISREERHRKCKGCYKSLMDIRLQLETKQQQTYGGKLAGTFRELQLLINNLD